MKFIIVNLFLLCFCVFIALFENFAPRPAEQARRDFQNPGCKAAPIGGAE
jgi:hypothetical protein